MVSAFISKAAALSSLTVRERECLRLCGELMPSKRIALNLGMSPHTVDHRLNSARRKLGVATRQEAAQILREYEKAEGVKDLPSQPLTLPNGSKLAPSVHASEGQGGTVSGHEFADANIINHMGGSGAGAGPLRPVSNDATSTLPTGEIGDGFKDDDRSGGSPCSGDVDSGFDQGLVSFVTLAFRRGEPVHDVTTLRKLTAIAALALAITIILLGLLGAIDGLSMMLQSILTDA